MQLNLYSYAAILDNVHNTVTNFELDEPTKFTYANIEFAALGYITNFSDISVKCMTGSEICEINLINVVVSDDGSIKRWRRFES